jgi:hypothetical protein
MDEWTPITPMKGGLVHMTSLTDVHRTQCGKITSGWRIALLPVSCEACKEKVHMPVKRPKKKKVL